MGVAETECLVSAVRLIIRVGATIFRFLVVVLGTTFFFFVLGTVAMGEGWDTLVGSFMASGVVMRWENMVEP